MHSSLCCPMSHTLEFVGTPLVRVELEPAQFAGISVDLHINFASDSPGQQQPVTALSVHRNVVSSHLPNRQDNIA